MKKVCNYWSIIYILVVTLFLPLYIENRYFNITEAKRHAFFWICVILLPIGIVLFSVAAKKHRIEQAKISLMDAMVFAFAGIAMISCLLSGYIRLSMFGTAGWGIGAFTWVCLALSYFLISRLFIYNHNIWLPVLLVNAFIIVIAILQATGADPFGLHKGIVPEQLFSYYGTIGNTNWWTGYLCLLVPLVIAFLADSRTVFSSTVYLIFWGLLSFAILICSTDGVFLGLGISAFFIIPFLFKTGERIEKAGWMVAVFGLVLTLYSSLPAFSERIADSSGFTNAISKPVYGVIILAAGIIWSILSRLFKSRISDKLCLIIIIALEIMLGCVALWFLVNAILEYNDYWGTLRGKIWNDSIAIFRQLPVKSKLIGIGPELLGSVYIWTSEWLGRKLLVAHSEPLQYLLTTGIIGLAAWLGIWVSMFRSVLKDPKSRAERMPFFLAAVAYLGQSLINSATTTNIAILFIMLALIRMPKSAD